MVQRWRAWVLPALWYGVISWFSSDPDSGQRSGGLLAALLQAWVACSGLPPGPGLRELLHLLLRKAAHLLEYGLLAALVDRARPGSRQGGPGASAAPTLAICLAAAALDEIHQAWVPGRAASAADVALDLLGASLGVLFFRVSCGYLGRGERSSQ